MTGAKFFRLSTDSHTARIFFPGEHYSRKIYLENLPTPPDLICRPVSLCYTKHANLCRPEPESQCFEGRRRDQLLITPNISLTCQSFRRENSEIKFIVGRFFTRWQHEKLSKRNSDSPPS